MKLKLDADGHVVVSDGKPVYVHDDGKEVAFDYGATLGTISRLNGEAKSHRERAEAAEGRAKAFEGIEDPAAALQALTTVRNLDAKKLVDAGEVEKIRGEAIKAVEDKYRPTVKRVSELEAALHQEVVGGSFARSRFIAEKLAIPADLVEAAFGKNFAYEGGKIVAKDKSGNPLYSRSRPGELADFDESMEMLVDSYPNRDAILKGSGASGGGAAPNSGGRTGPKVISRAQFEAMDPMSKATKMKEGYALTD